MVMSAAAVKRRKMPKQISPNQMKQRIQNLLQSGKIKQKTTELILEDKGQKIAEVKRNEFAFGQRPDRSKIGTYANPDYSFKKSMMNPLAGLGQVDLTLTGASNRSLFVKPQAGGFAFEANTKQWGINVDRYGKDIQSVNQKDFEQVQAKYHAPELVNYINEQLQIR